MQKTNTIQKVIVKRLKSLEEQLEESKRDLLNSSPFKIGDAVEYLGETKYILDMGIDLGLKDGLFYRLTDLTKGGKLPIRAINGIFYASLSTLRPSYK